MKRFDFRLERVRRWRRDQAAMEEQRLRSLYDELRAIETKRQSLEAESDRSRRSVLGRPAVTSEELSFIDAFRVYAEEQIRRLAMQCRDTQTRIEKQRARVIVAHRNFQLLDGLKDKALTAWTLQRDKEQEELAAELYLAKRIRDAGGRKEGVR